MQANVSAPGSAPPSAATARVLLVDDDIELAALLREYLEQEGFAVQAAHDGPSGVAAALDGGFDLVVLDVMLPGLSGIDALRRIRTASRIPVLMLTARGDDIDRVVGLELGADDYVPKPCTPRELATAATAITVGPFALWPARRRIASVLGTCARRRIARMRPPPLRPTPPGCNGGESRSGYLRRR
jgi:CheY-like chemotaxis protein